MNQVAILYPVFVQVLLVYVVMLLMSRARRRGVGTPNRDNMKAVALGKYEWPEDALKCAANYSNQFEMPVLFYAVVAFALIVQGCRYDHDRPGLGLRSLSAAARLHPHRREPGQHPHAGLCARRVHPARDVGEAVPARRARLRCGLPPTSARPSTSHRDRRPASSGRDGARRWGKAHRFAGSGDRSAIGNLVYDALRRARSLAAQMQSDTPRAIVLAAAPRALGLSIDEVDGGAMADHNTLSPLTDAEKAGLARTLPADTPADVTGDVPAWLAPSYARVFGDRMAERGRCAGAAPPPVDLRANVPEGRAPQVLEALAKFGAVATTPFSPSGRASRRARGPGSAAQRGSGNGARPRLVRGAGRRLADRCPDGPRRAGESRSSICGAGAGGKTLAFAAAMQNIGASSPMTTTACACAPSSSASTARAPRTSTCWMQGDTAALASLARASTSYSSTALHRHWLLAPPARCQVAPEAAGPRPAPQGSGAILETAADACEDGRASGLRHLLRAAGREL